MARKFRKSMVDLIEARGEASSTVAAEVPERWSSGKKAEVVLRPLRGEEVGTVSREVGVAAHELDEWRASVAVFQRYASGGSNGLDQ